MAFRYMEDFDREKMLKYAKGELALQNKPVTEENIEKKLDDLYYEWLASKVNDVVHKDDGIDDTFSLLGTLKEVPIKYCIIIEQWTENKSIHYKGKYFNFEDIYDREKFKKEENNVLGINILIESIRFFKQYEQQEINKDFTKMDIVKIKSHLEYEISNRFFHYMRDYLYIKNVLKLDV